MLAFCVTREDQVAKHFSLPAAYWDQNVHDLLRLFFSLHFFFIFPESWTLDKEQQTLLSVFSLSKVLQFRKQRDWAKIQNHRRKMANSNIYLGVYSTCQMKFTFCPPRSSLTSLNKISSYFLKDYLPKQNKDYSHYWATHKVFSFSISYITSNVKNILNQNNIHSLTQYSYSVLAQLQKLTQPSERRNIKWIHCTHCSKKKSFHG